MFEWNILLDLSGVAVTKALGSLQTQLLFEVLGESTRAMGIRVIHGGRGCGRFPRCTRWVQGGLQVLHNLDSIDTRTQT